MRNITIILDPAHGSDVKGKCSPDKRHREYIWSRERVFNIRERLLSLGYDVFLTSTSDTEIGLSRRRSVADGIKSSNRKLLLSLHNNASGNGSQWMPAQGASVYTTKGITDSDMCAKIILKGLERDFPEIRIRKYSGAALGEDFEENFTVLMGSTYMGVLVEWLFQDNKTDVERLLSDRFNTRFEDSIVESIGRIDKHFAPNEE